MGVIDAPPPEVPVPVEPAAPPESEEWQGCQRDCAQCRYRKACEDGSLVIGAERAH